MDGVILLNKPIGMTSFDAVNRCRRILHERKAGHTGTLDPNAGGLLIVLFGRYTKFLPYCVKDHKHYQAEFVFGRMTDTGDIWGNTIAEKTPAAHTEQEVQSAADGFLGVQEQIPPMYSALKVNGQKLVDLARQGKTVERKPRKVVIDRADVSFADGTWKLDAIVSGGTYIRTLINDLGESLGEYAVMSALQRTGIESLSLAEATELSRLEEEVVTVPPERVIDPSIPRVETSDYESVIHGRTIELSLDVPLVLMEKDGQILAAYTKREDGLYHCQRGLL